MQNENKILCADIRDMLREIKENSVDLILTDPPYPREFIECWSWLSEFGSKVLKNGGFCFAYSGQLNLPDVYKRMGENMKYVWQIALLHSGCSQSVHPSHFMCGYKPILVYCKQKADFPDCGYFRDTIQGSGRAKSNHPWEQSSNELTKIILHYTKPGDLIVDPFCGSGTTALACHKTGRKFLCIDKDEEYIKIAQQRYADLIAQQDLFGENQDGAQNNSEGRCTACNRPSTPDLQLNMDLV